MAAGHGIRAWNRCMSLAQRCTNMLQLKTIHAIFITHGFHHNNYAVSKLLAFCALSDAGSLSYASLLFKHIEAPNSFFYNTLIRAYSRSRHPQLALHYFHLMLYDPTQRPDQHTFPFVLIACANGSLSLTGKQVHSSAVKNGLAVSDGYVQTALIRCYVECKVLDDARKLFDEIPLRDVFQCNVVINGYVRFGLASEALNVFREMLVCGVEPDEYCLTTILSACASLGALEQGKWIHEYIKRRKVLESDVFVGTALVDMYAKCGCVEMAVDAFERMPRRNLFSWAAMIGGFAVHGYAKKAILSLERMQMDDELRPDGVVLLGVLTACTHAGLQKEGQSLLENMETQYGVVPKHEHYSCVVDLLCRAGRLHEALQLIRKMPMKPLASVWGALLSGCRIHCNIQLAEVAVRELLHLRNGDKGKEDGPLVQLSNIYLAAQKCEDARRVRRVIRDRGLVKITGCSAIEVDGKFNVFVSGLKSRT